MIAAAIAIGAAWAAAATGAAVLIGRAIRAANRGGPCCPLHENEDHQ
jgi:hypothetical protein